LTDGTPVPLPTGRQFALTWGVSESFGGMTTALLRRSRAFARLSDAPVEILTFDSRDDYPAIDAALRADGRLIDGTTLRNLWDDLTEGAPAALGEMSSKALGAFDPLGFDGARTRIRSDSNGTVLQLDRYRPDGSLAVSDRRDVKGRGRLGGRSIVICDAAGEPVSAHSAARAFYRAWLDRVVGSDDAVFIVDSKTTAPTVAGYVNPRVTRIHVMHNAHLVSEVRPWNTVKASRRETLEQLGAFDAVVVLSQRQRDDVDLMFHLGRRLEVVPNSAPLPAAPPALDRPTLAGCVVGSLDDRKRVAHAVDAVARLRDEGVDVTLDVYGEGPRRDDLEQKIGQTGLVSAVTLHGHRPDAVDRFATASFLLLTSVTEGFPLVLAEAMSRGCIPIAYDIPYGPADIIEDGQSGFLVPPGDVEGLAERVATLSRMSALELDAMRRAAVSAAMEFTDEAVVTRWAEVMVRATEQRLSLHRLTMSATRGRLSRSGPSWRATIDFRLSGADVSPPDLDAAIALHGTDDAVELRVPASAKRTLRHGVWRLTAELPAEMTAWLPAGASFTAHAEVRAAGGFARAAAELR